MRASYAGHNSTPSRFGLAGTMVSYRIEPACDVDAFGNVRYFIYKDERLVALYWHDYRGNEHGIEFVRGLSDLRPVGRVTDFMEGTDSDSPALSARGMAYLDQRT